MAEIANFWAKQMMAGAAGAVGALFSTRLGVWYFAAVPFFIAAGLLARQQSSMRPLGTAWIVGSQIITALVVVVVVAYHLGA